MKNVKSTKNANKATTATKNEGYGLGSSKDGWDGITSESDGYAVKGKAFTAWGVEVDGEISPYDIFRTREVARNVRNDTSRVYGTDARCSVRKLLILPIAGR